MSFNAVLLLLRIAIVISLYAFLSALLLISFNELRQMRKDAPRVPTARLIVVESEDVPLSAGDDYPLRPMTTLGRSPTCTIILPDTFASTEHARVMWRRGQWWLEDLDSRNGTQLNGIPVTEPVVLSSKDVIHIGRIKLRFESR